MESNPPTKSTNPRLEKLQAQAEHSRKAWRQLWLNILSITPVGLARMLLVLSGFGVTVWLVIASWPALAPFIAGGILAYIVLPLVNFLDRLLPRLLAALLGVTLVLAALSAVLWAVVPPLIKQTVILIQQIPPDATLTDVRTWLEAQVQTLPDSVRLLVLDAIAQVADRLRENASTLLPTLITPYAILQFVNALGFILGLFILPTWLLTVLKHQPRARRSLDGWLPSGLRADFWAVVRIIDRAFGTFLRGQMLVAFAVGLLTYLGISLLEYLTGLTIRYHVVYAVIAGLLQLIPEIGPIINILFAVFLAWRVSPNLALGVLVLYLSIQYITSRLVKDRVEARVINVNPAILVLVIVALSQLGSFWLFLAAPVAGVVRDLFRYLYGRLNDPPKPAGLLPDEPMPLRYRISAAGTQPGPRTPMIYRRNPNLLNRRR